MKTIDKKILPKNYIFRMDLCFRNNKAYNNLTSEIKERNTIIENHNNYHHEDSKFDFCNHNLRNSPN